MDDPKDVAVLNPEAGEVLRYNGLNWVNEEEGGITNVFAGDGLSGGGFDGENTIHDKAGEVLSIKNDLVTFNAGTCLSITGDIVNVNVGNGLTVAENSINVVPGVGLGISNNAVNFIPQKGLIQSGPGIRTDIGRSIQFNGNKFEVAIGKNLAYDDQEKVSSPDATYDVKGSSKFAPLVDRPAELRNTPSYHEDSVNPAFLTRFSRSHWRSVLLCYSYAPDGYLFCDGSEQPISVYTDLWNAIGTIYANGSEQQGYFRLPDLRGDYIRGANSTAGVDNGLVVGMKQDQNVGKHNHTLNKTEPDAATGYVVTPGGFPTSSTSGFVWGFGMNNCRPPHRSNGDGTFTIDEDGEYYFNFETNTYETGISSPLMDVPDEPTIPPGCSRVEFPVFLDVKFPEYTLDDNTPGGAEVENRPPTAVLLPCIKT